MGDLFDSAVLSPVSAGEGDSGDDILLAVKSKPKVKKPDMYRVILLNDDYTPMEFVIILVQHVFRKSPEEAVHLTLQVHNYGSAVCGVYTKEIAEMKVMQVVELARKAEHPLLCKMEKD